MSKQERKRKTSLGVLFWIAVILLILVVWLVNRQNIEQVMENTGLVEVINQRIGVDENAESGEEDGDQISVTQDRPAENRKPGATEDQPRARGMKPIGIRRRTARQMVNPPIQQRARATGEMMNRPIANLTNRLKMSRRWRPKPSHRLLKMLRSRMARRKRCATI
jgi:hypothetical protein